MKNKSIWKHVGCILFFFVATIIYFLPQFQGKELPQGDQIKWQGMAKEASDFHKESGENVAWCGSMFSGMPAYTVSTPNNFVNGIDIIEAPIRWLNVETAAIILLALLCGYALCITLGCSIPIAIFGAFAFAFSSYFPIIIDAGHVTKGWVMATMPIVIASMLLVMRGKLIMGGCFFAFSLTENIRHGHIQVTYYLLILCLIFFIGYIVNKLREKKQDEIIKTTLTLLAGVVVSLILNSAQLYSNLEMSKTSIRGKSELTSNIDGKDDKSTGLDQSYAFEWSYGKSETFTLLIPNFYGGASGGELSSDSHLAKALRNHNAQVSNPLRSYTYWGEQRFTSGPVYFGAVVCFLFVLALLIVNNKYKWWVVGATAFLIIMSWGGNCMSINDFLFHHLPFYNKFRTPSMALVIPQLTFMWLGCLALKEISEGAISKEKLDKSIYIAAGITGGFCLIMALFGSQFLSFQSAQDAGNKLPDWYYNALVQDREAIFVKDAWRSLYFILAATAILIISTRFKERMPYFLAAIAALTIIDLWNVDRRYLSENNFVKKAKVKSHTKTEADNYILQDKDPSYRVLTFNNTFNDTNVSYFHKSIGGYNAAKLRRYQDLIELHIAPEMQVIQQEISKGARTIEEADSMVSQAKTPILDMLNTRYIILQDNIRAIRNKSANGNAWFVKNIEYVNNADEEMTALDRIDPKTTAVIDKSFEAVAGKNAPMDDNAKIEMTDYTPMCVKYKSQGNAENIALFSEVYYQPGWNAYIDGKKVDHFRANWILRGLRIPAGDHNIEFKFEPNTYWNLKRIETIMSFLLIIGIGVAIYFDRKNKKTSLVCQTGK